MSKQTWVLVAGARPNFMKMAPLVHAIDAYNAKHGDVIDRRIVHTGQHYDAQMSGTFFKSLGIPEPDINLEIGSGSHAEQVGHTMIAFEKVLEQVDPDWVIVFGDVNATIACSISAKKQLTRVAHVESGLRSNDWAMPEEINRVVTDRLADVLFTTDDIAEANLRSEGVSDERIVPVGNIMIDSLDSALKRAEALDVDGIVATHALHPDKDWTGKGSPFVLVTMHRPSNVDPPDVLEGFVDLFTSSPVDAYGVVWPVHPRTRKNLEQQGHWEKLAAAPHLCLLEPVGYLEMLHLQTKACLMLTDSGGLQEESCVLGLPCLTMRWNTERPVTLEEHGGGCTLVGNDMEQIRNVFRRRITEERKPFRPPLWDGSTSSRIVEALVSRT